MKIGVLGAGMVGGALTKAMARRGHDVMVSSSDPKSEKMQSLVSAAGGHTRAGTNTEAAAHGELVILATPWGATEEIVRSLDLSGKILLDATNPIAHDFSGIVHPDGKSGGEQVSEWAPGAKVVKTLNQIGFALMDSPNVAAGKPIMWIAGDDDDAKQVVLPLVADLGLMAEDCGALKMSRSLEHLAWLWINRAIMQNRGASFAIVLSDASPRA